MRRSKPHSTPEQISLLKLANFLPKQMVAWEAVLKFIFILYGGARGPGKSRWLRWSLHMDSALA